VARVYLFNPQTSNQRGSSLLVTVNSGKPTYRIPYTYKAPNRFSPNSTSGNRVPGVATGNDFGDRNDLAVDGIDGNLLYGMDISAWPLEDMIVYFFGQSLALISGGGTFLNMLEPSGVGPAAAGEESAAAGDESAVAGEEWDAPGDEFAAVAMAQPLGLPGDGFGSVYIFNLFGEDTTVSLNAGPIGTIPAWNPAGAQPYTPSLAVADRVTDQSDGFGKIWTGKNTISLTGLSGDRHFDLTVPRPGSQDLLLYLLSDTWLLNFLPAGETTSGSMQHAGAKQATQ
jgi:hypothetical protein